MYNPEKVKKEVERLADEIQTHTQTMEGTPSHRTYHTILGGNERLKTKSGPSDHSSLRFAGALLAVLVARKAISEDDVDLILADAASLTSVDEVLSSRL